MKSTKAVLQYIKDDKDKNNAVLFEIFDSNIEKKSNELKETIKDCFPKAKNEKVINYTLWFGEYKYFYLGIYKGKIISFSEDGEIAPFCKNIVDLPFELLRRESKSFDYGIKNKTLTQNDILNNIPIFKNNLFECLSKYLSFLKQKEIEVSSYYFKDGAYRFLKEYFVIEYNYKDFFIEKLNGISFVNIESF